MHSNILNVQSTDNRKCIEDQEFRCKNGKCIPNSLVCNGVSDCDTGNDEENCGKF